MVLQTHATQNEAAYRAQKADIDRLYPPGRFLAIAAGKIVTDAETLPGLVEKLKGLGIDPKTTLAVQAGVDYPDFVHILHG